MEPPPKDAWLLVLLVAVLLLIAALVTPDYDVNRSCLADTHSFREQLVGPGTPVREAKNPHPHSSHATVAPLPEPEPPEPEHHGHVKRGGGMPRPPAPPALPGLDLEHLDLGHGHVGHGHDGHAAEQEAVPAYPASDAGPPGDGDEDGAGAGVLSPAPEVESPKLERDWRALWSAAAPLSSDRRAAMGSSYRLGREAEARDWPPRPPLVPERLLPGLAPHAQTRFGAYHPDGVPGLAVMPGFQQPSLYHLVNRPT